MAEYASEKKEQYASVHNGSFQGHRKNGTSLKLLFYPPDAQLDVRWRILCILLISVLLNLILTSVVIVLSVGKQETLPEHPIIQVDSCPNGWIGFQRRCYYFAEVDRNWTSSKRECSSFNASLVVINSQEEMDFIKRYKGLADHWIGLQRNLETEPWKWIDGTLFSNWFEVRGGGECGYMNHRYIASSSCTREERWICSKPTESWLKGSSVHHLSG